ncbi:MAG: TIGR02300 family protein [Candidatus Pelagibacterales bacterium]
MPKPEFGKKIICSNCENKFYDLNRKPAVCPHCGTEHIETIIEEKTNNSKQVFTDDVDTTVDDNLVGSNASESIADVEEMEIDDAMGDDTISLEDTDSDDTISNDVGMELNDNQSDENIDQD